jgi:hypothetical protein
MDKILTQLLSAAYGKNLIVWLFSMFMIAIGGLCWYCFFQAAELKACNADLVQAAKDCNKEKELIYERTAAEYKSLLERLNALEKQKRR